MTDFSLLDSDALDAALSEIPGWTAEGGRLARTFIFGTFREAISFVVRLAFESEGMDHHPEISIDFNRVTVALTTHAAGDRITSADIALAKRIKSFSWV